MNRDLFRRGHVIQYLHAWLRTATKKKHKSDKTVGEKGEKQGEINLIGRRAPCVLIVSCVQRDEEHKVRTRNDKKRSAQTTATTTHTQQDILGEKFVVVASDHDIINIIRRFSSREGKRAVDVKKKLFPSTGATHTHTHTHE